MRTLFPAEYDSYADAAEDAAADTRLVATVPNGAQITPQAELRRLPAAARSPHSVLLRDIA